MPAAKPPSQHRIPLIITCSTAHKQQIDQALSHIAPRRKSKYILGLIRDAIARQDTTIIEESYAHNTNTQFQISCSPPEKQIIEEFCRHYLDRGKRSRWIVNLILSRH